MKQHDLDTHNDTDFLQKRYEFGYQLLGPVIAEYLHKLYGVVTFFEQKRDAKVLFVSRAGIRIKKALDTFLQTLGKDPTESNADYFWISRLMVTKGIWSNDRDAAIATLTPEFYHSKVSDIVEALYRYEGIPSDFPVSHGSMETPGNQLKPFFDDNGPVAEALSTHLDQQSDYFNRYLKACLADHKTALLVDTGWAGTAQRLLADAFPDTEWWGAYFGRYGFEHTNRKYWRNMMGLAFEQDQYDFKKPETSIILNRHLIESLFEPKGNSIERLIQLDDGSIQAPGSKTILADNPDQTKDPIFTGVLHYLAQLPDGDSLTQLHKNARKAWYELSRIITLPTEEETEILSGISRSADFGKTLAVSLLLPTESRFSHDSPELRIKDALWPAGQAAIEYPPETAEPLQRKLCNLGRFDFKRPLKKYPLSVKETKRTKVAIITRTLDRPMFLKRALESVAGQTFQDYVHVVVNDGGDIELAKATIESTNCQQHKVTLVDNVVNRGMEAASNIAIRSVDSDYVIIHDDDDSWEPEFLAKTVPFLEGHNPYGGVITSSTYVSEEVTPKGLVIHGKFPYQGWVQNVNIMEMAMENFFPPIAFLFRRDIYEKIGGYNENYPVLGDWDFNLRFLLESDIGVINEPLANYHHRDKGDTSLFGNSVIAGHKKHLEYSAVVRNNLARNLLHDNHPALATMVGMGLHVNSLRQDIRSLKDQNQSGSGNTQQNSSNVSQSDDYWVAMNRLAKAIMRNDKKVLKKVGLSGSLGFNKLFKSQSTDSGLSQETIQFLINLDDTHYELDIPPDFDDVRYLDNNRDVAEVKKAGGVRSGFEHYYRYGRHEGRARPSL